MMGGYAWSTNRGRAAVVGALVLLFTTRRSAVAASQSFYFDRNEECTYPFSDFTVSKLSCVGSSYAYVKGYNDLDATSKYVDNESICSFGDTMNVQGSATLIGAAAKKFTVLLDVCYGGSSNPSYNPRTCTRHRKTLDLTDYVRLAQAAANNEELDETDYYLQPGTYQWSAAFAIPKKSFYFSTDSYVQVYLSLIPYSSYTDYPYSTVGGQSYDANIYDTRSRTMCYASFTAMPDENRYARTYYYRAAAVGIFLLGAATVVSAKRKVVCGSCIDTATKTTETTTSDSGADMYVREEDNTSIAVAP